MRTIEKMKKPAWKKLMDFAWIGLLLFVVFNADAKAWVLRQLMNVGLFGAEIKKENIDASGNSLPIDAFYFTNSHGETVSTASLKGKVVFLNFWATWCPPCIAEMPSLNALYTKLKDDERIVFLFVNEDENPQNAKSFLQNRGYLFPLVNRAGSVPNEVYSGILPTTVILNKEGMMVMKEEGLANYDTGKFLAQLKALL